MCGIFACFTIYNSSSISEKFRRQIYNALASIQHRGQDGYGIILDGNSYDTNGKSETRIIKRTGLLPEYDEFMKSVVLDTIILGHMRYSTNTVSEKNCDSSSSFQSIQPLEICSKFGIYLAHNGNLPNLARNIKHLGLESFFEGLQTSDTFLFKAIWDKMSGASEISWFFVIEYIKAVIKSVVGAYACVMTFRDERESAGITTPDSATSSEMFSSLESWNETSDSSISENTDIEIPSNYNHYLFGFRDRMGYKPLSIGYLAGNFCFISESVQLGTSGKLVCDVAPGEIWMIKNNEAPIRLANMKDDGVIVASRPFVCSMESIYFMRSESVVFGGTSSIHNFRRRIGMELGKAEKAISKNAVIAFVPESARSMAEGFAEALGKTVCSGLIVKIENVRSFIENNDESRIGKLKRKFAFNIEDIKKIRELVLIDDSVVRGNTMRYLIQILYEINCDLRIHLRIGSPPLVKGCNFGIDLYDDELIASKIGIHNLASYFNVASIEFLNLKTLDELYAEFGMSNCKWCFGQQDANTASTMEW